MTLTTLLVLAGQSGLILSIALAVCRTPKAEPALRLAVCRAALVALAVLLIWRPWTVARPRPLVPVSFPSRWTAISRPGELAALPPRFFIAGAEGNPASHGNGGYMVGGDFGRHGGAGPQFPTTLAFDQATLRTWAAGSILLAGISCAGSLMLWRVRRRSRRLTSGPAVEMVRQLAAQAAMKPPDLRVVDRGLFVAGLVRPAVYLPRLLSEVLSAAELAAVLKHEVAHITNRDLLWGAVRRGIEIALWWHPLVWMLRRPMEDAAEELCDRHVLASGFSERVYADSLLRLKQQGVGVGNPALAIGAVSGRSSFGARIEAILDSTRSHVTRLPRFATAGITTIAASVVVCAPLVFACPTARPHFQIGTASATKLSPQAVSVVDSHGQPVSGASAWLLVQNDGSSGSFAVEGVKRLPVDGSRVSLGTLTIPAHSMVTLVVHRTGFAIGAETLGKTSAKLNRIVLGQAHTLVGTVMTPQSIPVAGLRIAPANLIRQEDDFKIVMAQLAALPGLGLDTITDAKGRFVVQDIPASSIVGIDHSDDGLASFSSAICFQVSPDGKCPPAKLTAWPASRLAGRVTWNGRPVPGVVVSAGGTTDNVPVPNNSLGTAVTDGDGRYTIGRLPAGRYDVQAQVPQDLIATVTAPPFRNLRLRSGQIADASFSLMPGALITGRVFDEKGAVLKHEYINVSEPGRYPLRWSRSVETDAEGRYRLQVPPGEISVSYWAQDRSGSAIANLATGAAKILDVHTARHAPPSAASGGIGYTNTVKP